MKNKGFTLIELIGTIVILALIALVVFPATLSVLNKGQNEVDNSVKETIIAAAHKYVTDNLNNFPKQLESKDDGTEQTRKNHRNISVTELYEKGYIEKSIYDRYCHIKNDEIEVKSNSKKYFYEYKEIEDNEEC